MTRTTRFWSLLAAAAVGSLLSSGCGGVLRQAVVGGLYSYVSGGISQGLTSSGAQTALQDFFTSLLFPGAGSPVGTGSPD